MVIEKISFEYAPSPKSRGKGERCGGWDRTEVSVRQKNTVYSTNDVNIKQTCKYLDNYFLI